MGTPIDRRRIAVRVTPDALRQVKAGHPWLFDHSITSLSHDGASGDLAVVFDSDRKFAAVGLFDPDSPIRIKVLHHGRPVTIDAEFWSQRFAAAAERRAPLVADGDTTGYRLVHGENDQMPGLVVDVYARTAVVKLYSAAWFAHLATIETQLTRLLHPERIVLRLARNLQHPDWSDGDTLMGTPP